MNDACDSIVRNNDKDRFLLGLHMPRDKQKYLWPLFAFNYEIAKTREVVTETQLGLIRLQWWRDALADFYENDVIREHEVFMALTKVIRQYDLPRKDFEALIYAREFDLEDKQPATMEGLINYADFTTTPLNRLVLKVLGQEEPEDNIRAISIAYALAGLVRAIPAHLRQGRCYLPKDSFSVHDVSKSESSNDLSKLVESIVDAAQEKIDESSSANGYLRECADLSGFYLKRIKKFDFNPFDQRLSRLSLGLMSRAFIKNLPFY